MSDHQEVVLSKRLALGALAPEEALAHSVGLAYAVRRIHQEGNVCGCLDPESVVIGVRGVRLSVNGAEPARNRLTAYTSPEQLVGDAADARSDIFAFGAIVYEMFSGYKAFAGRNADELRKAILERGPAPLNGVSEEVQRVLGRCLQKTREDRWQRMSPILIELKLASASARQVQQAAEWKEKMGGLRTQIAGVDGRVTANQLAQEAVTAELRNTIRRLEEKANEQAAQHEKVQEALAAIRDCVTGLQKGSQVHARAIESLEAAIAQTDEVVEHVVDAFGLSQKPVVERAEAFAVALNGS